jgi:hypothetical protein
VGTATDLPLNAVPCARLHTTADAYVRMLHGRDIKRYTPHHIPTRSLRRSLHGGKWHASDSECESAECLHSLQECKRNSKTTYGTEADLYKARAASDAAARRGVKENEKTDTISLGAVYDAVASASAARDWPAVLRWESTVYDLQKGQTTAGQEQVLHLFTCAMRQRFHSIGSYTNRLTYDALMDERIVLLGTLSEFHDQAMLLCEQAEYHIRHNTAVARHPLQAFRADLPGQLLALCSRGRLCSRSGVRCSRWGKLLEELQYTGAANAVQPLDTASFINATKLFAKARKIAEANGFISIESRVEAGLGAMSSRGFNTLPPHANVSHHVLDHEAISFLRNAAVAGSLAEVNTTELQVNALYNMAMALFKWNGEYTCPSCDAMDATTELEHVAKQFVRAVAAVGNYKTDGWIPRDISGNAPCVFVSVDSCTKSRELISPTTPNYALVHMQHYHIRSLLYMKKCMPEDAVAEIQKLLTYIECATSPTAPVTRSSLEDIADGIRPNRRRGSAGMVISDDVISNLNEQGIRTMAQMNFMIFELLERVKAALIDPFGDRDDVIAAMAANTASAVQLKRFQCMMRYMQILNDVSAVLNARVDNMTEVVNMTERSYPRK